MRYRALGPTGDYQIGRGSANFLINSSAAVAQSVQTRLKLWQGEWFLDITQGTPWLQNVFGKFAKLVADMAIRARVLATQGVTGISAYQSTFDPVKRTFSIVMSITTVFDGAAVPVVVNITPPPVGGNSLDFSQADNSILVPAVIR